MWFSIYSKEIALRQMSWGIPVERLQSLMVGCSKEEFWRLSRILLHWKAYFIRNGQKMKSVMS